MTSAHTTNVNNSAHAIEVTDKTYCRYIKFMNPAPSYKGRLVPPPVKFTLTFT